LKEGGLDRTLWRTRFGWGYGSVVRQTAEWKWMIKMMVKKLRSLKIQSFVSITRKNRTRYCQKKSELGLIVILKWTRAQ
jgi:hypothetical protein